MVPGKVPLYLEKGAVQTSIESGANVGVEIRAEGATLMFEKALAALHRARATIYIAGQNEILLKALKPEAFNAALMGFLKEAKLV